MNSRIYHFISEGRVPEGIAIAIRDAVKEKIGQKLVLTLADDVPLSSDAQRAYYFGVIVKAYQDYFLKTSQVWYDPEDLHDSMMQNIGGFKKPLVNPFTGEPQSGRLSYRGLTKAATEGYHTLLRQWLAEHGVDCPEPNEPPIEAYAGTIPQTRAERKLPEAK